MCGGEGWIARLWPNGVLLTLKTKSGRCGGQVLQWVPSSGRTRSFWLSEVYITLQGGEADVNREKSSDDLGYCSGFVVGNYRTLPHAKKAKIIF